jgi:tetratricopeptide (TPR) repeat protein
MTDGSGERSQPPGPAGARTTDELSSRLRQLRSWSGLSYREIHRRVVRSRQQRGIPEIPVYNTIYRCLSPGRSRLDVELVVDIAMAVLGDELQAAQWRQVHQVVAGLAVDATVVQVADTIQPDAGGLVGRADQLDAVLAAVSRGGSRGPVLIDGMPGVGKTTLALHLAGQLIAQRTATPAGEPVQLSVNLRGYDPVRPPVEPGAVLEQFLRVVGASGSRIQSLDLAARSAMFRELVADRQVVVLLDNAASDEQISPLLVDAPGCLTLVTSRRRLSGPDDAVRLHLDVLKPAESSELLARAVGVVAAQEAATVSAIAELAGHLPLALSVVAGRIRASPGWTLADHLDRLTEHRNRLRLDDGVAVALALSYEALSPTGQELLRLLAHTPCEDLDLTAVAALIGTSRAEAALRLAELQQTNLVLEYVDGRFALHDLVRVLAGDRGRDQDPAAIRRAALDRLLGHYRFTVDRAVHLYAPTDPTRWVPVADPGSPPVDLVNRDAAHAWLETERSNLLAIAAHAAEEDRLPAASNLAVMLHFYLVTSGYCDDAETLAKISIRGAADESERGRAYNNLGGIYWRLGRYADGRTCYQRALELARLSGNQIGQAGALANVALSHFRLGEYAAAIDCNEQALALFDALGNRSGVGSALAGLGWSTLRLGRADEALARFEQELSELREHGTDTFEEAHAMANIGAAHLARGDHSAARHWYLRSLALCRRLSFTAGEADAINGLGRVNLASGRIDWALAWHQEALAVAERIGLRAFTIEVRNDYGHALFRAGRLAEALDQHRSAWADAEELQEAFELGRARAGAALAAQGKPA